jgi:hypothetical protein
MCLHIVISLTYHLAHVKTVCKGAALPPPPLTSLHPPPLLHYGLVVTNVPFSPAPFQSCFTRKVVVFWQQC